GSGPEAPQVGDVRIRYKTAPAETVSLVARQTDATFEPHPGAGGEKVDLIKPGTHSAQALFASAQSATRLTGWIFRAASVLLLAAALFLVLRHRVHSVSGLVPEGIGAHASLALFALLLAFPLGLLVSGGRWVVNEPGVGAGLLGAGGLTL